MKNESTMPQPPDVPKDGLDMLFWFDGEAIFMEAISADSKDHLVEVGVPPELETWVFGVAVDIADFLAALPQHFCIGFVMDKNEVSKTLPSRLH